MTDSNGSTNVTTTTTTTSVVRSDKDLSVENKNEKDLPKTDRDDDEEAKKVEEKKEKEDEMKKTKESEDKEKNDDKQDDEKREKKKEKNDDNKKEDSKKKLKNEDSGSSDEDEIDVKDIPVVDVEPERKEEKKKPFKPFVDVVVHVYDLSAPLNDKLFKVGLGLYHSGVELVQLDKEYWFQGHDQRYTGILEITHREALRAIPQVRQSINLGKTPRTVEEIQQIVDRLTLEYRGFTYNVLKHNCNAFCVDLVRALNPEKKFPGYINRMAGMGNGLMKVIPDSLVWWSMGKFGVHKSDVEIVAKDEGEEPSIDRDGTVTTADELKRKETIAKIKGADHGSDPQQDDSAKASYQSLAGASEGVSLLDRRGMDDSVTANAAAKVVGSNSHMYGPVHLMSAPQQRLFVRTMFQITLAQMEQRMINEIMMDEIEAMEEEEQMKRMESEQTKNGKQKPTTTTTTTSKQ